MTTRSPDEALHFRGKTLTPESPRPLHISEPSNIPVLENQMDPVFNDTSTYAKSEYSHCNVQDEWSGPHEKLGIQQGLQQGSGVLHAEVPVNDMAALAPGLYANRSGPYYPANLNTRDTFQDSSALAPPVVPVTQRFSAMNEIENTGGSAHVDMKEDHLRQSAIGANLKALLDNFSQSSSAAPSGTAPPHIEDSSIPQAFTDESQSKTLPARPPLHDPQPTYPSQNQNDVSYHQSPSAPSTTSSAYEIHSSNPAIQSYQPITPTGTTPTASSHQPQSSSDSQTSQEAPAQPRRGGRAEAILGRSTKLSDDDAPWGPEVQKKYDEFLHDERVYVTEGLWDRFPNGSRLFVGNLPTERVTKRDMFHRFHRFGKLAQISIKQAYGFIQFLEASSCHAALQAEQGALVRGRKVHLEISKPQRSTKPGPAEPARAPPSRRSRSPEFSRTGPSRAPARTSGDRFDRSYELNRMPFSDYRDEPSHRRRDDYRPQRSPRSPSPRPFRSRDDYRSRDRTPDRFERRERRRSRSRSRSRSPYSRDRRYRSHSPRPRGIYEGEADLPVPRRSPRDVPEVQVLVLEEVDRNFILHVENAFRNRGLRVDVLVLGPRIPLGAAVHRQYVEGVLAVVRLSRPNQFSRKIPLQIFDRSAGSGNVHFSDYPEVDPNIAAEVMFHQAQSMMQRSAPASYVPNPAFPVIPVVHPTLATLTQPPNMANLISSLDGPSLQSLLSALQRQAPLSQPVSAVQSPFASPNPPQPTNLASLLTNAAQPTHLPMPHTQHLPPAPAPAPFNLQHQGPPVIHDPNLLSLLAKGIAGQQAQGQAPVGTNVQNLMSQLSKWKQ